jgi:hypothetical protein
MPSASNLVSIDLIRLIMARSDHCRTRAEECRARAETSFTPEAWLKLAATWLALIPVSREAASERSKAKQPVGADVLAPEKIVRYEAIVAPEATGGATPSVAPK